MSIIHQILEWALDACGRICHNYGCSILLFTLFSKVALLPVSVQVHKNTIKMVRMQPEINFIKAEHFGDPDTIAEEQARLFQREKYHPFVSVIPLLIQVVLLIGLVDVIRAGVDSPREELVFLGISLDMVPQNGGGMLFLCPVAAGLSALLLCLAQNKSNVLQSEQSKANKYGMMAFSVGLSLYLGWFVPAAVALYWMAGNLLAVAQLYLLNWVIRPADYVDYAQLKKSRQRLQELERLSESGKKQRIFDPLSRREREDYKKFFSIANKHLVFYSESSGFYKYFEEIIAYLLCHTNLVIHYITSDPEDAVFQTAEKEPQIHPYYIGHKKLITLMMKMDADLVLMTMPDLENYHIKRSYVRKDIEYIFLPHGMGSINLTFRTAALDHFDTVFCTGKHQKEEVEKTEAVYGLPKKRLLEFGYPLLDRMRRDYEHMEHQPQKRKSILIAPSWQEGNIVDSCLYDLLESLHGKGYQITVRPHPQQIRHQQQKMEQLKARFAQQGDIEIQTDFSSNRTVFTADLVITDWSDIAFEYAFTTGRQVLFVDTPMKVMNPAYERIDTEPFNIWIRERIGRVLKPEHAQAAAEIVGEMLACAAKKEEVIYALAQEYVYHPGISAAVGAKYMIRQIQKKAAERKGEKA